MVNNIPGAAVKNVRLTLRQGDIPSMELFSFGIDPLLCLLERVLQGILICSIPVLGPKLQHGPPPPPVELRYKVIGYADDSKPAITSMQEFTLVDKSLTLFESLWLQGAQGSCKYEVQIPATWEMAEYSGAN